MPLLDMPAFGIPLGSHKCNTHSGHEAAAYTCSSSPKCVSTAIPRISAFFYVILMSLLYLNVIQLVLPNTDPGIFSVPKLTWLVSFLFWGHTALSATARLTVSVRTLPSFCRLFPSQLARKVLHILGTAEILPYYYDKSELLGFSGFCFCFLIYAHFVFRI